VQSILSLESRSITTRAETPKRARIGDDRKTVSVAVSAMLLLIKLALIALAGELIATIGKSRISDLVRPNRSPNDT
jgi:hypothetical protein